MKLYLPASLLLLCAASAPALTITQSLTAPTGSNLRVSQPDFSAAAFSGTQDFSDNVGAPGQTFTAPIAFTLSGLTVKGFANTSASFGGLAAATMTITISRVVGTTLTLLDQETASAAVITDGSAYLTFALTTPVPLASGTQYAYSIYSSTGYFGFAKSASDVLAGGSAMQQGSAARTAANGDAITGVQTVDRTFYATASVPEPGSLTLGLLGSIGLAGMLRRRRA